MSQNPAYRLAGRMSAIEPSPFMAVLRAAQRVAADGMDVLSLSMGEPDFETPAHIKAAGMRAIERGDTRYTAMDGTLQLKDAIRLKLVRDNDLEYSREEVTVTLGGTQGIFNALLATVGPGDEVILPAPYFQPYLSAIKLAGGTPVIVSTRESDDFALKASDLEAAVTPKTRWLILNSPSNPSGAVIGAADLRAIAAVVRASPQLLVLTDDIYESITFEADPFQNLVNVAPDLRERVVILNGVSKAYAMTGWRVGYLAGPRVVIEAISQVSATSTFTPCSITQAGAAEALSSPQDRIASQLSAYRRRRAIMVQGVAEIPELTLAPPKGAFYIFPGCERFFGRMAHNGQVIRDDLDFVMHLLESEGLAGVQGSAFGTSGHFRLSFAVSDEKLRDAVTRLQRACAALR